MAKSVFGGKLPTQKFERKEAWDAKLWKVLRKYTEKSGPARWGVGPKGSFVIQTHNCFGAYGTKANGEKVKINGSKPCRKWDVSKQEKNEKAFCPLCEIKVTDKDSKEKLKLPIQTEVYLFNLDRDAQKKAGHPLWTPTKISANTANIMEEAWESSAVKKYTDAVEGEDDEAIAKLQAQLAKFKMTVNDDKALVPLDEGDSIEDLIPSFLDPVAGYNLTLKTTEDDKGFTKYLATVALFKSIPLTPEEAEALEEIAEEYDFLAMALAGARSLAEDQDFADFISGKKANKSAASAQKKEPVPEDGEGDEGGEAPAEKPRSGAAAKPAATAASKKPAAKPRESFLDDDDGDEGDAEGGGYDMEDAETAARPAAAAAADDVPPEDDED